MEHEVFVFCDVELSFEKYIHLLCSQLPNQKNLRGTFKVWYGTGIRVLKTSYVLGKLL